MSLPKPYYQDEFVTLYCGDCLELLTDVENVEAVITDPPYGTRTKPRGDEWMVGEFANILPLVLPAIYKAGVPNCAFYSFTSWTWMADWIMRCSPYFRMQNFIIWDKGRHSGRWTEYAWQFCWEGIYFGIRGPRPVRAYQPDVIHSAEKLSHPMQKPVDVIEKLILASTDEGHLVLDCFAGSGSTLIAAKQTGRKAIGIEIEESQCEIAANRLRQSVLPFSTPPRPAPAPQAGLFDTPGGEE